MYMKGLPIVDTSVIDGVCWPCKRARLIVQALDPKCVHDVKKWQACRAIWESSEMRGREDDKRARVGDRFEGLAGDAAETKRESG